MRLLVDRRREAVLLHVCVPVDSRKNKNRATVVGVAGNGHSGGVRLLQKATKTFRVAAQ